MCAKKYSHIWMIFVFIKKIAALPGLSLKDTAHSQSGLSVKPTTIRTYAKKSRETFIDKDTLASHKQLCAFSENLESQNSSTQTNSSSSSTLKDPTTEPSFVCVHCKSIFTIESDLNCHLKVHRSSTAGTNTEEKTEKVF